MNTAELKSLVATRFAPPSYGLLWEVGQGTGAHAGKRCDGLAMSLWPSRGLELIGLELKVSRGDWVKERDNPGKSEPILQFCDRWYLVIGDASIVHPGELPPTWGMIAAKGGKLTTVKEAPKLKAKPLSKVFTAALFRRSAEQSVDEATIKSRVAAALKEYGERRDQEETRTRASAARDLETLRKVIREFETAAGFCITDGWRHDGAKVGQVVKAVLAGQHDRDLQQLEWIEQAAVEIQRIAGETLAQVKREAVHA